VIDLPAHGLVEVGVVPADPTQLVEVLVRGKGRRVGEVERVQRIGRRSCSWPGGSAAGEYGQDGHRQRHEGEGRRTPTRGAHRRVPTVLKPPSRSRRRPFPHSVTTPRNPPRLTA